MKKLVVTLMLSSIVLCSVNVHAQQLTVDCFSFAVPDEYTSFGDTDVLSNGKGIVSFLVNSSEEIDTEDEYKAYLELMASAFYDDCYSYTISYGTKNAIHYIKFHGFYDTQINDTFVVSANGKTMTIFGIDATEAVDNIHNSICLAQ